MSIIATGKAIPLLNPVYSMSAYEEDHVTSVLESFKNTFVIAVKMHM